MRTVPQNQKNSTSTSYTAPSLTRSYLILREPDYGRYSNNRMQFAEALGVALFSDRTLIVKNYRQCDVGHSRLYNLGLMGEKTVPIIEDDGGMDLVSLCGNTGVYLWYDSITKDYIDEPPLGKHVEEWRGISWETMSNPDVPIDDSSIPKEVKPYAATSKEDVAMLADIEPYRSAFPRSYVLRDLPSFMVDSYYPYRVKDKLKDVKCVMVQVLYLNINWAMMPGVLPRVAGAFLPSPVLEAQVQEWFVANNVKQHEHIGLHIRLKDLATGLSFGFAHDCTRNATFVIEAIEQLQSSLSIPRDRSLIIASDDFESPCTKSILSTFPNHVRAESGKLGGCMETSFVQEVLMRTSGFIGNSLSTFTIAVHWGRIYRYGHPLASSKFPENGPAPQAGDL